MHPPSILVAIANHGTRNLGYVERVIQGYRTLNAKVDIVVLSDVAKDLGRDIEVRVGAPTSNPWSLPFAHRPLFQERADRYDYFIYTEDDTLLLQHNFNAFIEATEELAEDEIAGFLRYEQATSGERSISSIHSHFRWDTRSVRRRGKNVYAEFSNEHSACFILTQKQLLRSIASGGFLVEPHEGRYDMLCSAATDPYTRCGLKKVVCITRLDDFLLHHLPNKYIGRMGISRDDLEIQKDALIEILQSPQLAGRWFDTEPETGVASGSKNCYEIPDPNVLSSFDESGLRILSVGCGWGKTEQALMERGHQVAAIPVDHVFGRMAESRGLEVISGPLAHALERLGDRRFDAVLMNDVLQLLPTPSVVVGSVSRSLVRGGRVVAKIPNGANWRAQLFSAKEWLGLGRHAPKRSVLRGESWLSNLLLSNGVQEIAISRTLSDRAARIGRVTAGLMDKLLSQNIVAKGTREGAES